MGSMQWQLGREMGTIPAFVSRTQENQENLGRKTKKTWVEKTKKTWVEPRKPGSTKKTWVETKKTWVDQENLKIMELCGEFPQNIIP